MSQQIGKALKQLIAVTRPRPDQSEGSVAAMAERFLAVFSEYPEPIVLGALNAWPKHSEWFPTEKELRELLDYLRLNDEKAGASIDTRGRSDKPSGMTKHFYEAVARIKGEAYARSWLRGGVTAMFTDRYVYVNHVGHDRLWRDLSHLIRECGVAIIEDDSIATLLVDYIERNGIGNYEPKRRRA
jgi:hypothetical protein